MAIGYENMRYPILFATEPTKTFQVVPFLKYCRQISGEGLQLKFGYISSNLFTSSRHHVEPICLIVATSMLGLCQLCRIEKGIYQYSGY